MNCKKRISCTLFIFVWALCICQVQAQSQALASASYTPTWAARHYLQWLSDQAGLPITSSHWPLPAAALVQALEAPKPQSALDIDAFNTAREFVLKEIEAVHTKARLRLHLRTPSAALNGYAENYTPASSAQLSSPEGRHEVGEASLAWRLGARLEANDHGDMLVRPDGSAFVLGYGGWQLQAFSQQYWWGPGWQSSLVNGHNNPAWLGVGIQRGHVAATDSPWLSWLGPWNLDFFVAKANDPWVVTNQPQGFLFSGMRLTMKPKSWLELGLSRGLQTSGSGRPSGMRNFANALLGQQVNQESSDTFVDSSSQIAGFDARLSCPIAWVNLLGSCAVYTQWMGEDAAGQIPFPYKFMTLWGFESGLSQGRYRAFAELTDTNANSLPWDTAPAFPGYVNGVYRQGYSQGGRWVGPAQGSGSQVITLGWLDASRQRLLKFNKGRIHTSLGSYDPRLKAPHGGLWGFSMSQTFARHTMTLTPELGYTQLAEGSNQRGNKRNNWRLGMAITQPF